MCVRTSAVLLLLHLLLIQLWLSAADRLNDKRTPNQEVRARRHNTEERQSGRRWTTSRNSPYQKIVSSYETEPEAQGVGEERGQGDDQAKAKSHKRKQWRTSASAHDQIASETSSAGESGTEEERGNGQEEGHQGVQRTPRRRSTTSHPPEVTTEPLNITTVNPKKRRRPSSTTTTTTLAPQTMSDTLYQYFRPLEQDLPQDDIIPFLDFGRKLSPVIPTPSGANSIENRSSVTKLRPREHREEKESNSSDEEILQEDMDVTVVKKAIERNSVPRGKLRVQSSGISDYYRKRVPAQVRTTENLISSSDSSTASSVSGGKNNAVLKKVNRHQVHHVDPTKIDEKIPLKQLTDSETEHIPKDVEVFQERRKSILRPIQRSAPLKQESPASPLTAESTLVKTVIKEVPEEVSSEAGLSKDVTTPVPNKLEVSSQTNSDNQNLPTTHQKEATTSTTPSSIPTKKEATTSTTPSSIPTTVHTKKQVHTTQSSIKPTIHTNRQEKTNPKILSTAVVTSVSVQESLKDSKPENTSDLPLPLNATQTSDKPNITTPTNLVLQEGNTVQAKDVQVPNYISNNNSSNNISGNSTIDQNKPSNTAEQKNSPAKNTSLPSISREIYKQRNPARIPIHLPRQLSRVNTTQMPTSTEPTTSKPTLATIHNNNTLVTLPDNATSTMEDNVKTSRTTATPEAVEMSTNPVQNVSVDDKKPSSSPTTSTITSISEDEYTRNFTSPHLNHVPIAPSQPIELTEEEKHNPTENPVEDKKIAVTETTSIEDHHEENNTSGKEADHTYKMETESEPPPSQESSEVVSFVPVYPSEEGSDDQFPILFTTPPPVVDTRPETEYAVVEEQRNSSTTSRPAEVTDWVKASEVNKEVEVVYPDSMGLGTYLLAALGVVPVIVGALIGARFILAHNRKKVLDESEYSSEYNRSPLGGSTSSPLPTKLPRIPTHVSWSEREPEKTPLPATAVPTTSPRWEFPREKLRLQTLLGQGNFGQVWKAEADDIAGHEGLTRLVAVKTVKESANAREREDLLRELGIMQELGSHPNVVTLLGCCTEKEPIYLMMEYVMYGKLLSFLRDHRTRAHYYNFSDATDALTSRDLTVFGYCVARGMDYLANKSIIHRDMAARNVLVDHNKLCKIADFGMSRNVRDTGQIYEQRQSKGALPIRWMAPESLHFSLFTHKTDVWSFGILMWEIVTLGSTPYATMGAREVMRRVRDGYRLERPSHCRTELFRVISRCWHSEPSKRPTFAELKVELAALLSDPELHGSFVDLDSFADEMRRDTLHRH